MVSISLGMPQLTMSSMSFSVRVGRSTTTPGRLTFLRSLQSRAGRGDAQHRIVSVVMLEADVMQVVM